jgi:hypothetical protein
MNASRLYFECIKEDLALPAVIPVEEDGVLGMATVTFDVGIPRIEQMVYSESNRVRATIAIFACDAARTTISTVLSSARRI